MGADVVRHKLVRDTVVDENGFVVSTSVHDVELHESQEKHRDRKIFYPNTLPERPSLPPLVTPEPPSPKQPRQNRRKGIAVKAAKKSPPQSPQSKPAQSKKSKQKEAYLSPAYDQPAYWTCPQCGERMASEHIANHLLYGHTPQGHTHSHTTKRHRNNDDKKKIRPKPGAQSKPQSFNDNKSLIACPVCGASVRSDNLGNHMRGAHLHDLAKRNSAPWKEKGAPAKAGKALAKGGKEAAFEHSRIEREQDGSKNIGYLAREQGRFGSHPMHDDYAYEGGAD